jgi:hypothetical protein
MRKVLNNKVLLFIVAVLLIANIAQLIYSVGMRDRGRWNFNDRQRSPITGFLKNDIGFDKQQMEAYDRLREQHKKRMWSLFQDIRLAKVAFYNLLSDTTVNDTAVNRAASTIGEKQKALELQTFQNFREIRGLSSSAQLPKYDSLVPGLIGRMWFPGGKENFHSDSLKTRH